MITVCPLSAVETNMVRLAPSHLISLLHPNEMIATPPGFDPTRHLRVGINDIIAPEEGCIVPEESHVNEVIEFLRGWRAEGQLLIHCWAGVSRSTATAFIALCLWNEGREHDAARAIRQAAPHAQPNRRIVHLADQLLRRNGRMNDAVAAMGPARIVGEGTTFTMKHIVGRADA